MSELHDDDGGALGERWLARMSSLEARLDRIDQALAAAAAPDTGAVASALESLTNQLNLFTATLAAEIRRSGQDAAAASRAELEATSRQIADLAARTAPLGDLGTRVDMAIAGIAAVRDELAATGAGLDQTGRFDALAEATARVEARVAQTLATVGQTVADAVAADRSATSAAINERMASVDAVRNDLVGLRETVVQRLAGVDTGERLEALRDHIEQLGRYVAGLAERLPTGVAPALEDVSAQLIEVRHTLNRTSAATVLDALRDDLAQLRADLRPEGATDPEGLRALLEPLVARLDGLHGAIDGVTATVAAVSARPDAAATLGAPLQALREDVGALAGSLASLGTLAELPTTVQRLHADIEGLATIPAALDGLGGAVEGAAVLQRRSSAVVEALQAELQSLRAEVGAAAAGTQHVGHSVEETATRLLDATRAELLERDTAGAARFDGVLGRLAAIDSALAALGERPGLDVALDPVLDRMAASNDAVAALHAGLESIAGVLGALRAEVGASRTELAESTAGTVARLDALVPLAGTVQHLDATITEQASRLEGASVLLDGVERIEQDLASMAATIGAVAAASARLASGADVDRVLSSIRDELAAASPLTHAQLAEALAGFGASITAGPAPASVADLDAAAQSLQAMLAAQPPAPAAHEVAAAVVASLPASAPAPAPVDVDALVAAIAAAVPPPLTPEHLAAGLARLHADLAGQSDPAAVAEAVRASLPTPLTSDQLQVALADLQASLPAPATAADLEQLASRVTGAVSAAVASAPAVTPEHLQALEASTSASLRAAVAETSGDLRAELRALQGAVADLAARRATGDVSDPLPAIEAVATAVDEARQELQLIADRQAEVAARGGAVPAPDDDTAAQLDALGRLVHHAVRSLHLIEAATVGVSPRSERARAEAAAALRDLDAARQRRAPVT